MKKENNLTKKRISQIAYLLLTTIFMLMFLAGTSLNAKAQSNSKVSANEPVKKQEVIGKNVTQQNGQAIPADLKVEGKEKAKAKLIEQPNEKPAETGIELKATTVARPSGLNGTSQNKAGNENKNNK